EPDGPEMDFALLRVGKNGKDHLPGDQLQPKCLSTRRLRRGDPLYVVGYPRGQTRAVHDNAFVQFPFRATDLEKAELELVVESESADPTEHQEMMDEFQHSYRCCAEVKNVRFYENYSFRWGRQPTIGADADTYHGDSGSPVFDRRNHQLVGMLIAGEDDLEISRIAGWRSHEAILPASCVVAAFESTC